LNGASPAGGGIGGSINLLPKRAPNEPLNRVSFGAGSGGSTQLAADIARRFGPDGNTGGYPGSGYLTVSAPRTVSLSASVDF
jgi:iron complex outermembrane receptor protein